MKHVRIVTREMPVKAYWWNWIGQYGAIKQTGKPALVNFLWGHIGSVDPDQVGDLPGVNW